MTQVQLLDLVRVSPFRPFEIHMDNGMIVRVVHPDCVYITPRGNTVVVAEGEHLRILGMDHISEFKCENK